MTDNLLSAENIYNTIKNKIVDFYEGDTKIVQDIYSILSETLPNSTYKTIIIFFPILPASDTDFVYDIKFNGYYDKLMRNNIRNKLIELLKKENIETDIYYVKEKFFNDSKKRIDAGIIWRMTYGLPQENSFCVCM